MVVLKGVANEQELAEIKSVLATAKYADGAQSAGAQAKKVKHNLQLVFESADHQRAAGLVTKALHRNALFFSAALPAKITPVVFNRYEVGMDYGAHVDNAYMGARPGRAGLRSDLAATLFLNDPAGYDGGELTVHHGQMVQRVKLPPGDMVLYPANSRHRVEPVTRGVRDAAVFWVQSMVRDAARRQMLHDFDRAVQGLIARNADAPEMLALSAVYNGLLREWLEI